MLAWSPDSTKLAGIRFGKVVVCMVPNTSYGHMIDVGHATSVAWHGFLAIGCADGLVHFYDTEKSQITMHANVYAGVVCMAYSNCGQFLAISTIDKLIHIVDAIKFVSVQTFAGESQATGLSWSRALDPTLTVMFHHGRVNIAWSAPEFFLTSMVSHTTEGSVVTSSVDGKYIYVSDNDQIEIWQVQKKRRTVVNIGCATLKTGPIRALSCHGPNMMVVGEKSTQIRATMTLFELIQDIQGSYKTGVISPNGRYGALLNNHCTIKLFPLPIPPLSN